jgi:hypothetical protein
MGYSGKALKKKKGTRATRARRGKGEEFTGAKENAVQVREGELNLQTVAIPANDFRSKLRAARDIVKQQNQLKSAYSHLMKGAKDIDEDLPDALKLALSLDKKNDGQVVRHLQIHGFVLRETGSNIQITLQDLLMSANPKQTAYRQGYEIGAAGKGLPRESNYPIHSELDNEFVRGHADGQRQHLPVQAAANDEAAEAEDPETAFDEEMEREGTTAA